MAGAAAAARSRQGAHPGLRHPLDPQDPDQPAPGLDDPRLRPGLPAQGLGHVPRGLHDPYLDLAQLPDPGLARRRPAAGRAGGVRAGQEAGRDGDGAAREGADPPAAQPLFPLPDRQGHDPAGIPQERHRIILRAREGLDRLLRGVAHRRVRARPQPADPRGRLDRGRRQHVQERLPDEQVRHPDQQDLAQQRAVHDQYRHDAQLGRLPDRRAGADRQGAGGRPRGFQPGRAGGPGAAGPQPDPRPARPARLQPLPRPLPPRPGRRHARGRSRATRSSSPTTRTPASTCRTRTTPSTR